MVAAQAWCLGPCRFGPGSRRAGPCPGQAKILSRGGSRTQGADERLQESTAMITNYPAKIFVIIRRFSRSNLSQMQKKLHLSPGTTLFMFVNNTLPQIASLSGSVYDSYKDMDDFLYMCHNSEKTFS
ncbi:hypothetical protein BDA96_08G000200 [Sorghum bicolor]|uniref:Autophagy-related protein n=2 Tax=Sorghum bicolor TaxID=4558 RepID=A0A921QDA5_SORBI|nr:hypothetical protein BDA96_08G000200 [Sorghum bicolor]